MNNVTTATFTGSGRKAEACPLFQYDFGQILKIEGLELPSLYEVDFGNDRSSGTSITVLGDADGVEIPNQLLETGEYVFAWIVLHEGEDDRETEYMVEIPVIRRAEPSDEEPTPEQMTIIEQLTAEVAVLKEEISELGGGLSDDVKQALLQIASKVAYIDDDGATYYQDLYDALYPSYTVTNTLTGCTTSNAAASAIEGSAYSATITASSGYTLTGATVSITMGGTDITSTAYNNGTISIASVTGNLIITVTAVAVTLSSISAVYTQSGTVYDSDTLDSLKDDLVVTSHWSDSSTATVDSADYTLSGTLTAGTSTITVSFGGKTTTFTVTVTHNNAPLYTFDDLSNSQSGRSLQITNGNHIKMISTVNSKYMYARFTELAGAWSDKSSNPLFSLSPTDELSLTIKNITYSGNTTGGKFNYYLVNASADTNVRSANDISLPTGSTTVTDDTRTVEVGGEATASIGWIKFWLYRPVTFECDIELYVNGARYI